MVANDSDDNALVLRVCRGEREAYREIVKRHQGRLFYLGLRFFHTPPDAEDFTQDVFLRAYENLDSFRAEVPFGAWLYRLAFNLAVNRYHFNRRRLEMVQAEPLGAEEPEGDGRSVMDPQRQLQKQDLKAQVEEIMKSLPDVQRLMLRMHYFDGLSYPEICRLTEIPVNTIKSHIFRAKGLIRRRLSHLGEEMIRE